MLKRMEKDGHVGHSETICLYSDGDGDFRPEFNFDMKVEEVKPLKESSNSVLYDAG